jgi:ATP-dependent RNA helicase RhlE
MNKTRSLRKRDQGSTTYRKSLNRKKSDKTKNSASEIDPKNFVKKATSSEQVKYEASSIIATLPINKRIVNNLLQKGYEVPTEIQDKTLSSILEGRNVLGIAQTGTGKTAAFLVPLVHNLINTTAAFQVLIIAPTRELAVQTNSEFQSIAKGLGMYSNCFIGGTSVYADIQKLRKPCHFVIGTPGRLADMVRQGALNLTHFNTVILDEFDRLLDMGFAKEIERLVEGMTNRKQTILFSATEEKGQRKLINKLVANPVEVRVNNGNASADTVDQDIVTVRNGEDKMDLLLGMIKDESFEKVLIFAETKRWVSRICKDLRRSGIRVDEIHGNKSQNYRLKALNSFKDKSIQVLVATDVAARGLDISQVSHVINYQQPRNMDSYIHRIGRTGRAGNSGKAITFVN